MSLLTIRLWTLSGLVVLLRCLALLAGCWCVYLIVSARRTLPGLTSATSKPMLFRFASIFAWTHIHTLLQKIKGKATYAPIGFAFIFSATLIVVLAMTKRPENYIAMHGVHVLDRVDDYTFRAEVKDPATGEWYEFYVNACHDFKPTKEIQRGVTLKLLQYVEDRTNSCDELDGHYAGYILMRDEYGAPILSNVLPRPPAASGAGRTDRPEQAGTGTRAR